MSTLELCGGEKETSLPQNDCNSVSSIKSFDYNGSGAVQTVNKNEQIQQEGRQLHCSHIASLSRLTSQ